MLESNFAKRMLLWVADRYRGVVILFRNNTGMGWTGEVTRLSDGSIIIRNPRPLRAGLCTGSGDYIGWMSVLITQQMVGKRFARFISIETKRSSTARRSPEQVQFNKKVTEAGGIAVFASDNKEVEIALNGEV